jgi:hypothetical protein
MKRHGRISIEQVPKLVREMKAGQREVEKIPAEGRI